MTRNQCIGAMGLLAMFVAQAAGATTPEPTLLDNLPRLVGRLHPVLVHFPIALLMVGALFEFVAIVVTRQRSRPSTAGLACVAVGAVGAGVAAWAGWLNADIETHSKGLADLIETHRWLGIASAGFAALALVAALIGLAGKSRVMTSAYRVALVVAAGLVGAAGHWGGSLVYGEDYITGLIFPEPESPAPDVEAQEAELAEIRAELEAAGTSLTVDFATQIAPIFGNHCIDCHGPDKQKGGLRLDARRYVFDERGPDEQVIIPGDAEASDLYFMVGLPPDDEDVMPPEGKGEPLTAEQIALLETWINEGAVWLDIPIVSPKTVPEGAAEASQAPAGADEALLDPAALIEELLRTTPEPAFIFDEAAAETQRAAFDALRARGAVAQRLSQTDPWAEVRFDLLGEEVTDDDLALLESLAPTLESLNLAGTGVTDDGLARLAEFPRLAKLNLGRTAITDAGIAHLSGHPTLRYLNLYDTGVTDQGLVAAAAIPNLQSLYLWNTGVSPQAGALLAALKDGLTVEVGGELTPATFDDVPAPTGQTIATDPEAGTEATGSALPVNFTTQIAPIFADHCIKCHGPDKQKGDLRLDARRFVFDERDADAQVIIPGDARASDLYFMISLPAGDEDRMPPEGEGDPLTGEELALLETWINQGAVWLDIPAPTGQGAEADTSESTGAPQFELASLPGCCRAAIEAGGECDHPCCVEARARGEICQECLGN